MMWEDFKQTSSPCLWVAKKTPASSMEIVQINAWNSGHDRNFGGELHVAAQRIWIYTNLINLILYVVSYIRHKN